MIKTLFIFISVLLVFIASAFFYKDEKIDIQPSIPSAVRPGDEFIVELTLNKGLLEGFASLQQYLPEGFTATAVESRHAEFVFENQHVKFTWKELPKEKSFTISYKIKTDVACYGLKTMNGEFSYIENDKAKKIPLTPSVIMLSDDAPLQANSAEQNREIVVEKLIGTLAGKTEEYKVELKISKGLRQNAARIFDQVLEGYRAELIDAKGAKFSVAGRMVEFYWESLPKESVFTVSYYLVPDSSAHLDYSITDLLAEDNGSVETCSPVYLFHDYHVADEKAQLTVPLYANIPAPQKGIFYKVQIAATMHSPARKEDFFLSRYKINESVDMTMDKGWRKYLVGTFEKYTAANRHRMETQAKIPDAFVVAFNNDERIPLREALNSKNRNQ